jgi:hypothetical protein
MSDHLRKFACNRSNRPSFIGCSDARIIMGDDEVPLLRFRRDIRAEIARKDLPLGAPTNDPNRHRYDAVTGRMPIGWHVAAVCYATAAILLGWRPWNFLLLLLLFPISNRHVRFYALSTTRSNGRMRPRVSFTHGSSL